TEGLLAARDQLANAQQPFVLAGENLKNLINTLGTGMQAALLQAFDRWGVDDAMRSLNKWLADKIGVDLKGEQRELEFRQWLRDTAQGKYPKSLTPAEMGGGGRPPGAR